MLLSPDYVFSQGGKEDVVYLKNGSVIRGKIKGYSSLDALKIETEGKNIWVFKIAEIDSVKQEEIIFPEKEIHFKQSGFYNLTDCGILAGRNSYQNLYSPSVITINGYRFHSGISCGIGIGAEILQILSAPVFGELRYDIIKKKNFSPFVSIQSGYAFPLENNYTYYGNNYKGGILINPEIGFRNYFSGGMAISLSIGYRYQELHSTRGMYWGGEEKIGQTETITYFNRLAIRFGFLFN